ncbi:hypothetical protein PGT21_000931 [Puccinia graminis f. sp. tritici]|uniref:Uncharacterized protein n=1 Tax=Puccinia graminis f. sp. tritici TaxID=56615 RepID=A0A5B0RPW5_PUCGR|nr:hypothetical protein PGT21_000931 [Puccinia graminis f. sp. tritici]KAA1127830.1 hypothetical protein PGTUg99_009904 [Puccinia graminis f. sp. tritici]
MCTALQVVKQPALQISIEVTFRFQFGLSRLIANHLVAHPLLLIPFLVRWIFQWSLITGSVTVTTPLKI